MQFLKYIFSLMLFVSIFTSCGDDEAELVFDYQVTIAEPSAEAKHLNDDINVSITFRSQTEETIHHISVRIYNKLDNVEIYNKPETAHIHETSGTFEFIDVFTLSEANGVTEHSDWILEAKVWGHEPGLEEVIVTREFHVHPE